MSEPTGGLTFEDLVIRVAEYLGVASYGVNGDGAAAVPTDAHDLALCKRLVNDGIRMFIADNSKWRWTRKLFSLDITNTSSPLQVSGDPARYYMPEDFNGDAMGRWTYGDDEDLWPRIVTVPEHVIREYRSVGSSQSGFPLFAAFRPLPDSEIPEGQRARWEVIFYPDPGQPQTVMLPYRHYFNRLTALTQRQPAGAEFDEAIEAAALAKAELDRDDVAGGRMTYYKERLEKAINIDLLSAPRVGPNLDRSSREEATNRSQLGYERPVRRVTYGGQ